MSKGARWDSSTWKSFSDTHVSGKRVDAIYTRRECKEEFNPLNIAMRESRDSDLYPESNAIIIAEDVTGSMSPVLNSMIKEGLPKLADEIYTRKPITDPHIMFMGVGDVEMGDSFPLQCTQFEGDIKIAEQLKDIFLEGHGGGNNNESYHLPWVFAGLYTSIDCFERRGKKGYLFTMGDEFPPGTLSVSHLKRIFKNPPTEPISIQNALAMASRMYHVYHLIIEEGHCARQNPGKVLKEWNKILGQNALPVSDHTKVGEIIVSAIQMNEGATYDDVVRSWDGTTSVVVANAFRDNAPSVQSKNGIVTFK